MMALASNRSPGDPEYATSVELAFPSVEDFRRRLTNVKAAMKTHGVHVLVLGGHFNHRYLTGLDGLPDVRPVFLVVCRTDKGGFVTHRIEQSQIAAKCDEPVVAEWGDWTEEQMSRSFQDAVAGYVKKETKEAITIGFDYDGITGANLELLQNALGVVETKDVSEMLRELRRHNDAATINLLRACADIAVFKMKAICGAIKPGVEEWRTGLAGFIAETARAAVWLKGDENHSPLPSSFIVMGSGERSKNAHSVASCREMLDGDLVELCCCTPPFLGHGICFDRPVKVGSAELSEEDRKKVKVAREAHDAAVKMLKPRATAGEVYAAAMAVIKRHGYEKLMQHGAGRSIGCGGPEISIVEDEPTVFEEGDVVGIEPGVGGIRFGNTFLIVETGCEALTPVELFRDLV